MKPAYVSFNDIIRTTNRLPLSKRDIQHLSHYLQTAQKNGMDVAVHQSMRSEGQAGVLEWFENGILVLNCPQIESDVLFAKIYDGKGLFGGEKARFMNYLGDMNLDEFLVGSSHKLLALGLTGINEYFSGQWLIEGGSIMRMLPVAASRSVRIHAHHSHRRMVRGEHAPFGGDPMNNGACKHAPHDHYEQDKIRRLGPGAVEPKRIRYKKSKR